MHEFTCRFPSAIFGCHFFEEWSASELVGASERARRREGGGLEGREQRASEPGERRGEERSERGGDSETSLVDRV